MQTKLNNARVAGVAALSMSTVALLVACGGDNGSGDGNTVSMTVEASAIPAFVAADRGFFDDIEVDVSQVGYDEVQSLLVSGDTDVAWVSPLETAQFVSQGEDFRYFSTAGAQNMYNGVVVRTEDADQYTNIGDLAGHSLGIPGFGTGTWVAFEVFTRAFYGIDDAQNDFDVVTADSGALLALVEQGEVDASLLFSGTSAAARSLPEFTTVFSFTEAMQEETGQPLPVNGAVATGEWLEANPELAAGVVEGLDEATQWIIDNPDAFSEGGEYQDLADAAGWLTGPETTSTVQDLISQGKWFLTSDAYTQDWIDAVYTLVESGEGAMVDGEIPAQEDVFLAPDSLPDAG